MVRNFEKFEIDHWYIYTGTRRLNAWNDNGRMDYVLNHKAYQCKRKNSNRYQLGDNQEDWIWFDGFDNWIEIEHPNIEQKLNKGEKFYIRDSNIIQENRNNSYVYCSGQPNYALKRKNEKNLDNLQDIIRAYKNIIKEQEIIIKAYENIVKYNN